MSASVLIPAAQSDALLREIRRQTREESRAVAAAAEQEARAILAQAHADARRRMHEAVVALRREARRRTVRAEAQAETEARRHMHRRADEAIGAAWPLLEQALTVRWRDTSGRRSWIEAVARTAAERLRPGPWTIEHPSDWSAEERDAFRRIVADVADPELTFTADAALAAGLRIHAGHAVLDATVPGLLADRAAVAAELLAEVEATP